MPILWFWGRTEFPVSQALHFSGTSWTRGFWTDGIQVEIHFRNVLLPCVCVTFHNSDCIVGLVSDHRKPQKHRGLTQRESWKKCMGNGWWHIFIYILPTVMWFFFFFFHHKLELVETNRKEAELAGANSVVIARTPRNLIQLSRWAGLWNLVVNWWVAGGYNTFWAPWSHLQQHYLITYKL